jgi:hypothetical protein
MDKYLKAIKQNVCSICVDSNERGGCKLTDKETCAVELYLPQIVEIVTKSETENVHELHKLLKEKVCTECRNEVNGNCYLRADANCSLDRYYWVIIETIQRVNSGKIT